MERAVKVSHRGEWPEAAARDSATLSHDERCRRRVRLRTDGGQDFLLDLPRAIVLEDGDGLALESGEWIAVRAAGERLVEITCVDGQHLARIAWHLGNRHVATQVEGDRLLIREDRVIVDMVRQLGARVHLKEASFHPEGGAYGASWVSTRTSDEGNHRG